MATTVSVKAMRMAPTTGATAPPPEVPTTGSSTKNSRPALWAVLGAFAIVAGAWGVGVNWIDDPDFAVDAPLREPLEGLTIFAVFFVSAHAIERLIEPLTKFFGIGAQDNFAKQFDAAERSVTAALEAAKLVRDLPANTEASKLGTAKADAESKATAAKEALDAAATAKANLAEVKGNRAVIYWALASAVAIVAAAALKLYLLRTVGIAQPPRALDLLATGLILGAGTKPLHDLVTRIEKKKDNDATDVRPSTATAAGA